MSNRAVHKIFLDAISSVLPNSLLPDFIKVDEDSLFVAANCFAIGSFNKLIVISCGKAAASMASVTEGILEDLITDGLCITKKGHSLSLKCFKTIEAGHPYPDDNSFRAGQFVVKMISSLDKNDIVLLLISGGASSLLSDIPAGCTAEDIIRLNKLLVNSGASIQEINIVRKHVSKLKGGNLSKLIYPATTLALYISDVPGDKPADIGSGLTCSDPSTFKEALNVLTNYNLVNRVPTAIISHLERGLGKIIEDTPKPYEHYFSTTYNKVIGSNSVALEAAAVSAKASGFSVIKADELIEDDVYVAARMISSCLIGHRLTKPLCFLWGGETTLRVSGNGFGGRNQHLALSILKEMKEKWIRKEKFTILCAGTDGTESFPLNRSDCK